MTKRECGIFLIGLGLGMIIAANACRAQEAPKSIFGGANPSVIISGSTVSNWELGDLTIPAAQFRSPRVIRIVKTDDCRLVVLEDTPKETVLGCRKEAFR